MTMVGEEAKFAPSAFNKTWPLSQKPVAGQIAGRAVGALPCLGEPSKHKQPCVLLCPADIPAPSVCIVKAAVRATRIGRASLALNDPSPGILSFNDLTGAAHRVWSHRQAVKHQLAQERGLLARRNQQ